MPVRIGPQISSYFGPRLHSILWLAAFACFAAPALAADESQAPAASSATEPHEAAPQTGDPESPAAEQGESAKHSIVVDSNIEFARPDGEPLHCDVYRPAPPSEIQDADEHVGPEPPKGTEPPKGPEPLKGIEQKRPAVLLVHGGGWASGDKWTTAGYARAFAESGMVAVTVNYRLAPTHKFPAQVDDIRAALAWVGKNADQYGIDTKRVGMFGYSAGAHLVCMIGTLSDADWSDVEPTTEWEPHDPRWQAIPELCAIVGGGAPCEFRTLPLDNTAISFFLGGPRRELPEVYRAASPAAHASSGDVPMLFVHGTSDLIVPHASSRILYEAQIAAGVASEYLALDGSGHMLTFLNPETRQAAIEFLTTRLGE